jgi:hypothetical protein
MRPEDVPDELVDLAMTGASPGCRADARFYLANVLPTLLKEDVPLAPRRLSEQAEEDRLRGELLRVVREWERMRDRTGRLWLAWQNARQRAQPHRRTEQDGGPPNDAVQPGDTAKFG